MMWKIVTLALLIAVPAAAKTIVFPPPPIIITCDHETGQTTNNFHPHLRFSLTPIFVSSNSAFSLLAEVGGRHYRANATLGIFPCEQQKFKLSVEYLVQKMHYNFSTGQISTSVHQIGSGAKYQYGFYDCGWLNGLELGGTYAYAPSHDKHDRVCNDTLQLVRRHVAGSHSYGISTGAVLQPFECGQLTLSVNYDNVKYETRFHQANGKKKSDKVNGFGASFEWNQRLCCCYDWNIRGQFLRPYNYLESSLKWVIHLVGGDLAVGIFGGYTKGKGKLPSSSVAGLSLGYSFGVQDFYVVSNGCAPCDSPCAPSEMYAWVTSPAVYIPEVLAIAEQSVSCPRPRGTTIPPQVQSPGFWFLDVSTFFTAPQGSAATLTFSASGLPADATLDADSGFITGNNPGTSLQVFNVTITATDQCGSSSQSFQLTYNESI